MNNWLRIRWNSGQLVSTPLSDFWQVSRTEQDPPIPNLPLESPAGGSAQTLTQSASLASSNAFYAHSISQTAPAQTLTQSARFDNANTFNAHVLTVGAVTLTQSARHDNQQTFPAHVLTPGAVALTQSARFDNANGFYGHALTPGPVVLEQSATFAGQNTFYGHEITASQNAGFVPRRRRTVLVELDGKRFIVHAEDAHKWIADKTEEVENKPKLRKLAVRPITKAKITREAPQFIAHTSDAWLLGLVAEANRKIVARIMEIRREIEAEDEIIFLMAA